MDAAVANKLTSKSSVTELLKFSMDEKKPPKNIFEAAQRNDAGYIKKIAERTLDFNVNMRDQLQRTALHWAAELGNIEAAELLIDFGIDVKAVECNGRTAVHLAARSGDRGMLECIMELISPEERTEMINQADNFGVTPLYLARQKDKDGQDAFEYMILNGGRINEDAKKPAVTTSAAS
ncbi:hypothetical protein VOLCADRAFT_106351 [Volvox carteri f. nagariensis]|uniref:Uncharacterized protein n=1 Tax=Volvox carteri f. nagariensis TaxID=3068 RepID=D8U6T6_VOLCA|nr:uncharacterized protein VOLCADRAFT_106351 [Volvox carteri f. nagariensis]EFJ44495.1 hypothetical protein VOLCADRAFT_106351 [Volvox carteri f. nagariensis]|eukprot:XP_002954345.1 hypothetical protein VOLCADRAFT_106351 [Volvox carteri f. nagariensis]